jgi:glycosyltransferase involved in cell wall biosynthesis
MRVGVDASGWANQRGFGRFTRNAVGRLVAADTTAAFTFYVDERTADEVDLPDGVDVRGVRLDRAPSAAASAGSSRSIADLLRMTRAVRRDRPDAFLFPSLHTYFPVLGTPTIVGVHDTIVEELPAMTVPSRRERLAAGLKHRVAVRRASRVFTVSEASRRAVAAHYGIAPANVSVVPEAPDPVFSPRTGSALAPELAAAGLASDARYVVYAGGISPHKNVESLIDAFALLREQAIDDGLLLVIVGDLDGETYLSSARSVRERIAHHGLGDAVRLPGYVHDETLACLYSGATAFVMPSLAEGFGLTAVEAAACGAAVVLSDLPPHRESLGDAALYFDPTDVAALASILNRIVTDDALREEHRARARAAVSHLSWDATATRLQSLISEVTHVA